MNKNLLWYEILLDDKISLYDLLGRFKIHAQQTTSRQGENAIYLPIKITSKIFVAISENDKSFFSEFLNGLHITELKEPPYEEINIERPVYSDKDEPIDEEGRASFR